MNTNLYNKMTDDERLQYMYEMERVVEALSDCNYIKDQIIENYKQLVNNNESHYRYQYQKYEAYERLNKFEEDMLDKYNMRPTPTCDELVIQPKGEENCQ